MSETKRNKRKVLSKVEVHKESADSVLLRKFNICKQGITEKLVKLKQYGILQLSLKHSSTEHAEPSNPLLPPSQNDNSFELLEFLGDSYIYYYICRVLVQTRRFMSPHLLTEIRKFCVKNVTLARVFDTLGLETLLNVPLQDDAEKYLTKRKADIVEAMIGEIAEMLDRSSSMQEFCKQTLDELVSYIVYAGEASFFSSLVLRTQENDDVSEILLSSGEELKLSKSPPPVAKQPVKAKVASEKKVENKAAKMIFLESPKKQEAKLMLLHKKQPSPLLTPKDLTLDEEEEE